MLRDVKFYSGVCLNHSKGTKVGEPACMAGETRRRKPTSSGYGTIQKMITLSQCSITGIKEWGNISQVARPLVLGKAM